MNSDITVINDHPGVPGKYVIRLGTVASGLYVDATGALTYKNTPNVIAFNTPEEARILARGLFVTYPQYTRVRMDITDVKR